MSTTTMLGSFSTSTGNSYIVRTEPAVPGFGVYRDQGGGHGYLLGRVSDPDQAPALVIDGGRVVTTGRAQEILALALDVWREAGDRQ